MVNLANVTGNVSADNKVSFCGLEYLLTDSEATKLKGIIEGMISTRNNPKSTSGLVFEEEQKTHNPVIIEGKKLWQEDFCTVTCALNAEGKKEYRLYITCPVKGDKGDKIRYAIKKSAKDMGAKFAGDYKAGKIYWAWNTRKEAEAYVATRKEYAKKSA